MKKFTRRSYNRKLIVFGISLLAAFGLISTGFSAWLMSSITDVNDATPPVSVSTITNEVIEVTLDGWNPDTKEWTGDSVNFDAKDGDETGRIMAQNATEDLKLELTGKVTNPDKVATLTIKVELPASIKAAIDGGYIKIKGAHTLTKATHKIDDSLSVDVWYYEAPLTKVAGEGEGEDYIAYDGYNTFSHTLEFEWGDYFGGVNPSVFYDSAVNGKRGDQTVVGNKDIDDATMAAEMENFHDIITAGLTGTPTDNPTTYAGTIYVTVKAATAAAE
ncbi:MAG: hypothetical protein IJX13_02685 [Clostridia bacterium]|nr:hypothetical protein [Clostridia bacterium]